MGRGLGVLMAVLVLVRGWVGKPSGVGALVCPTHWWDIAFR